MSEPHFVRAVLVLPVSDMKRARDWYADVLGFETVYLHEHPVEDPGGNYAILARHDAIVHLILDEGGPHEHPWTAPGTGYLFLIVRGVDAVYGHVRAKGITVTKEMEHMNWGARAFHLTDPSGNLILVAEDVSA